MPKMTVITSTYNRVELLPRAIESVLNQTFTDFEYIIVNNGSTDDTQAVIDYYAKQDSRVRSRDKYVNKLDGSGYDDKSLWWETAENHYYTGVDDDDYIHKDMLETLYHLATDTGSDICSVGSMWVFPDGSQKEKYAYGGVFTEDRIGAMTELLKREKINNGAGGRLYRKKLLYQLDLPTNLPRIRDIHREYRIFNRITQMTMTGTPMYYFYRHDSNLSGLNSKEQITPLRMEEYLKANRMRTEYLTEKMPEIADFALYSEYSFMISLTKRIWGLGVEDCYTIANQMADTLRRNREWIMSCGYLKEHEVETMGRLDEEMSFYGKS